jgi:hypothetical protein
MTHLDDVLCRLEAGELDASGQARARAHLETCADCRDMLERLRKLDRAMKANVGPTLARAELLARVRRGATAARRAAWILGSLCGVQIAAGALVLAIWSGGEPLLAGVVGGLLIGDSGALLAVALLARERRHRLEDATRDWAKLLPEWRHDLLMNRRAAGWAIAASSVLVANGTLILGLELARGPGAPRLALAVALLVVGIVGLIVHPLRGRRAGRELSRLEGLAPDAT